MTGSADTASTGVAYPLPLTADGVTAAPTRRPGCNGHGTVRTAGPGGQEDSGDPPPCSSSTPREGSGVPEFRDERVPPRVLPAPEVGIVERLVLPWKPHRAIRILRRLVAARDRER